MVDFNTLFEDLDALIDKPHDYNSLLVRALMQTSAAFEWSGGVAFSFDPTRGKNLSVSRPVYNAGVYGLNHSNLYLRVAGVTTAGGAGIIVPRSATITALFAKSRSGTAWAIEVRKNDVPITLVSVPVVGGFGSDPQLDIDVDAGDTLEFYLSGSGVDHPIAGLEIAWRKI